ncbi:MAG: hypothetical protein HY747_01625 [Elusimicrobia bacterium]|nr:hypothetical protein [Elusimicrobiota bacterium]
MDTVRLNITLPKGLGRQLEHLRNKSAFIAEALRERFAKKQKERMFLKLKEAYYKAGKEEARLNEDWDFTTGDNL